MARTADFFEIFKNNINAADARSHPSSDDSRGFFDDLLLDPEFDELSDLDDSGAEFAVYREIHGQPEAFR